MMKDQWNQLNETGSRMVHYDCQKYVDDAHSIGLFLQKDQSRSPELNLDFDELTAPQESTDLSTSGSPESFVRNEYNRMGMLANDYYDDFSRYYFLDFCRSVTVALHSVSQQLKAANIMTTNK